LYIFFILETSSVIFVKSDHFTISQIEIDSISTKLYHLADPHTETESEYLSQLTVAADLCELQKRNLELIFGKLLLSIHSA
jgi:hypothetical protein